MEEELHYRVIGQDEAITAISRALRRSRAKLKDPRRPIGSFIFLGPTGVGKTFLAQALAEFMFGNEDALIQLDMSEYMEKYSASRMVGSPPGYIGYEEGGQLTEQVRRRPYSVVLFDEVEKAHPDVMGMLLQILDEGKLTDSWGRAVDFRNTVVIMTSNVGAELLRKETTLGFGTGRKEEKHQSMKDKLMGQLQKSFKPEFLNRVDDIIVFHQLSKPELRQILDLEMKEVLERLQSRDIKLELTDPARDFLVNRDFDPRLGARPLRRTLEHYLEDTLAEELLKETIKPGSRIKVGVKRGQINFVLSKKEKSISPSKKSD